jgi:DNA-binding NarL/FixJ family response regulator
LHILLPPRLLRSGSSRKSDSVRSILIVDDYSAIRTAIRVRVESCAELAVCGEAADGSEAIAKALRLRPDLVILDLSMPRMNGLETASVLKTLLPNVRIIVFSMHAEVLGRNLAAAVGIDAIFSKTGGIDNVLACARNLLRDEAAGAGATPQT